MSKGLGDQEWETFGEKGEGDKGLGDKGGTHKMKTKWETKSVDPWGRKERETQGVGDKGGGLTQLDQKYRETKGWETRWNCGPWEAKRKTKEWGGGQRWNARHRSEIKSGRPFAGKRTTRTQGWETKVEHKGGRQSGL